MGMQSKCVWQTHHALCCPAGHDTTTNALSCLPSNALCAPQAQKWYLISFTGDDSEVVLDGHQPVEFGAWRWGEMEDLATDVVSFKRDVYEAAVAQFLPQVLAIRATAAAETRPSL